MGEAQSKNDVYFEIGLDKIYITKFVVPQSTIILNKPLSFGQFEKYWANFCDTKGTFSKEIYTSNINSNYFCMKVKHMDEEVEVHFLIAEAIYSRKYYGVAIAQIIS